LRSVIFGGLCLIYTLTAFCQKEGRNQQPSPIETVAPNIPGVVAGGTKVQIVKGGFEETEGPVALPDGSILFTETPTNRIIKIDEQGNSSIFLDHTNESHALALDSRGRLISAQQGDRGGRAGVEVIFPKGSEAVLADNFEGKRFDRPNDIVVDKKGGVYFTDFDSHPTEPVLPPSVYYIPSGSKVIRVIDGVERPNGIGLSPDEKTLYIANTLGEYLIAFDIRPDGTVRNRRELGKFEGVKKTAAGLYSGADGLAVDSEGRIFVTMNLGVQVFTSQGQTLGIIPLDFTGNPLAQRPQNILFGGPQKKTLFIMGGGIVFKVKMLTQGYLGRAK
jgi:gluconolactonase